MKQLLNQGIVMNNIILHIPHSSDKIPSFEGYLYSENDLIEEMRSLNDWYTDELFDLPYPKIVTPFSRIFCDVERFADDSQEIMAQYGMGMCYTHFDNGIRMREVGQELWSNIKSDYYDQHHESLEKVCADILGSDKTVLIIDCHSFPDKPLKRDINKYTPRPDFCIGTDEYHTPRDLVGSAFTFLDNKCFTVRENDPYSGTMIPIKHYQQNKNVISIMIEVNRKLYMKEINGMIIKTEGLIHIRQVIAELVNHLSDIEVE